MSITTKTPETIELVSGAVDFQAAAASDPKKPGRISGVAYGGGPVTGVAGWYQPVVTDLSGMKRSSGLPLLSSHQNDPLSTVGKGETSIENGRLLIEGTVSRATEAGRAILALAKDGVEWQLSIGATVEKVEQIEPDEVVQVNGKSFKAGPRGLAVIRQSRLREISVCAVGADANTSTKITQKYQQGIQNMDFEKWLKAKGFDLVNLTEGQQKSLRQAYDAEIALQNEPGSGDNDPEPGNPSPNDEIARCRAIYATCGSRFERIATTAIEQGWTPEKTKLEVFKANRPSGPTTYSTANDLGLGTAVIEAAVFRLNGQEEFALQQYGEQAVEQSRNIRSMADVVQQAMAIDGHPADATLQQGFSTASLPTILGNVSNRTSIAAYRATPSVAREIAKKLTAKDFKTHIGARLTGDNQFEQVSNGGELAHGNLSESTFNYEIDTYGKIFGITRQMIINDDLGAFLEIPAMIGRSAALAIEKLFWALVLKNTGTYFGTDNKNYISGADTALSVASLGTACQKFREQVDNNGDPLATEPRWLVVPPALEVTANALVNSVEIRNPSASESVAIGNPFSGKLKVLVSPYLSNTNITGYSTTAWYLFGDSANVPAFGIAFLNGAETPVIEDAPLQADLLGKAWRGYMDFGVCQIDHRGGVKSKGAA